MHRVQSQSGSSPSMDCGNETRPFHPYNIEKPEFQALADASESDHRDARVLPFQASRKIVHAKRPAERPFTRAERPDTTVLFGGLTWKHERLIQSTLHGLGYKAEYLPAPDVKAYQTGREFGNNGQCNPTYFTVGNLIEYLSSLEKNGLSRKEIIDRYVFFTAGACGPCRFGMYEAEFRLALRNAGFEGFRVLILEQSGGLNQAAEADGLEMNVDFTLGIINSFLIADIINDTAYQIRPFEVENGATDSAMHDCIEHMAEILRKRSREAAADTEKRIAGASTGNTFVLAERILSQLVRKDVLKGMRWCKERLDAVDVDRTRIRPVVKITGEFWAQTTEGDGNFNMFRFLEKEGAQVLVEPISNWLLYLLHQSKQEIKDRSNLNIDPDWVWPRQLGARIRNELRMWKKLAVLTFAESAFSREYNRLRKAMCDLPLPLSDQYEMQRVAHRWYNSRLEGGEGHLEIAKSITFTRDSLCHMVLSLKPFGCMPSTQSDGVQSSVVSHHREILFLPIETSGEGVINAYSRVQMALGEARIIAKEEIARVLQGTGLDSASLQRIRSEHPELSRPFNNTPRYPGVVGVAAAFALSVAGKTGVANDGAAV